MHNVLSTYEEMFLEFVLLHSFWGIYALSERLTARSREVSNPRYLSLNFTNRSEIYLAPRQQLNKF